MPPGRNPTDVNYSEWIFRILIGITGFVLIYLVNQKTAEIDRLNSKLDTIIQQNSDVIGDIKVINNKLMDFDTKFGDHEKRLRELELREARRGAGE